VKINKGTTTKKQEEDELVPGEKKHLEPLLSNFISYSFFHQFE